MIDFTSDNGNLNGSGPLSEYIRSPKPSNDQLPTTDYFFNHYKTPSQDVANRVKKISSIGPYQITKILVENKFPNYASIKLCKAKISSFESASQIRARVKKNIEEINDCIQAYLDRVIEEAQYVRLAEDLWDPEDNKRYNPKLRKWKIRYVSTRPDAQYTGM